MKSMHDSGFTLIELLIVLMVISLLSLTGYNHYQSGRPELAQVNLAASVLKAHVDSYYRLHCSDAFFIQPSIAIMQAEGVIGDTASITPPIGSPFEIQILNVGQPSSLIQITSNFADANEASTIAQGHELATSAGITVVWRFLPDLYKSGQNLQTLQIKNAYGDVAC